MRQQAYLTKWITLSLIDNRNDSKYKFYFEGWVKSYVNFLNKNENTLGSIFYTEKEKNEEDGEDG